MQYHIILLLAIFYRIACVRWVRARKLSYWFFSCALQHYCRNLYIFSFGLHLTIYLILSTLLLLMRWQLHLELKWRVVRFPFVICNFSVRVLRFSSFFFIFFTLVCTCYVSSILILNLSTLYIRCKFSLSKWFEAMLFSCFRSESIHNK